MGSSDMWFEDEDFEYSYEDEDEEEEIFDDYEEEDWE